MSAIQKQQPNPFPLRLEAQLKAKALRFQPGSIMGARETLSRVEMNAQPQAPLTTFPAPASAVCLDNGRCRHTRDDISAESAFRSLCRTFAEALRFGEQVIQLLAGGLFVRFRGTGRRVGAEVQGEVDGVVAQV